MLCCRSAVGVVRFAHAVLYTSSLLAVALPSLALRSTSMHYVYVLCRGRHHQEALPGSKTVLFGGCCLRQGGVCACALLGPYAACQPASCGH